MKEALEQLSRDIASGMVLPSVKKATPDRIEEDEWEKKEAPQAIQETYFIKVKDKLGNKHTILVDESDFTRVSEYDWWIRKNEDGEYVASTNIGGSFISLQQFILGIPPKGKKVVYKDRNRLNTKRSNMMFYSNKIEK